jgi:hypothetical protein
VYDLLYELKKNDPTLVTKSLESSYFNDRELTDQRVEEILEEDKKRLVELQQEYDPYLEALGEIESYSPANDPNALEKIVDHLNFIALTGETTNAQNQRLMKRLKKLYLEAFSGVSTSRDIVKNTNADLVSKTYNRLVEQYKVHEIYLPTEDIKAQRNSIIALLDILYTTTIEDEFQERFKYLRDKFSLDKGKIQEFSITLNAKQWEQLGKIANSSSETKIRQKLNQLLKSEHQKILEKKS